MTEQEHQDLYKEIQFVINNNPLDFNSLSDAQKTFIDALDLSGNGCDLLKSYTELVESNPGISIRSLHAFCIGFGFGINNGPLEIELTKTTH